MTKVFILPTYEGPDKADGGIRRVIEAMHQHLPTFGVEIVDTPEAADVVNYHAGNYTPHPNKPLVASCHGLHWTEYNWEGFYHDINRQVIEVMTRAEAVTTPSNWVTKAIARGSIFNPQTIYHGVNPKDWEYSGNRGPQNYVLWNKARADVISNPVDAQTIAERMTDTLFYSTIGTPTKNLEQIGVIPYDEMKHVIAKAGVYLCTARETFGIGTLEAMAAGVPIAGWAYGGQEEIVKHGYTGHLAPYGDYEALENCIRLCFENRAELSQNCISDISNRWQWPDKIKQYADLFKRVARQWAEENPKISIIVPCHNLGEYLPHALESVKNQTADDWECLIVDDDSTDNTAEIVNNYANENGRFKYISTGENIGLCQARNLGVQHANGRFINFLDADDMLHPNALKTLVAPLDDPGIAIAYGRLSLINEEGTKQKEGGAVPEYDFNNQLAHLHQFPIGASLIRKRVLINSGGFRVRDWRAEDSAWIARVTSFGARAKKATDETVLYYRVRGDSKSMVENRTHKDKDGDWTAWLGWRVGGRTAEEGKKLRGLGVTTPPELTPFGAYINAMPANGEVFNTNHNQEPLISVIIPVGPNHTHLLENALDSLYAQTLANWEAIVINDSGKPLNLPSWVTAVNTAGGEGAGKARNMGVLASRGDLILFLDVDDWLLSNCLEVMTKAYAETAGSRYIYTDYLALDNSGGVKHEKMKPYNQNEWKGQHAVNILIDKQWLLDVGLFDESMGGWEDWDLPLKLAINGYCGYHVNTPCFVYRKYAGSRREWAYDNGPELLQTLRNRYEQYYREVNQMSKKSCCGGNPSAEPLIKLKNTLAGRTAVPGIMQRRQNSVNNTRMKFTGNEKGAITYSRISGKKLQRVYKGANNTSNRYINAHPADVELLLLTGKWEIVSRPQVTADTGRPVAVNIDPDPKPKPIVQPAQTAVYEPPEVKEIEITPRANQLLEKAGINPVYVKGTGKDGKITVADARQAIKDLTPA